MAVTLALALLASPSLAETYAERWLQTCLAAAKVDPRPKVAAPRCRTVAIEICHFDQTPSQCFQALSNAATKRTMPVFASLPAELDQSKFGAVKVKLYENVMTAIEKSNGATICSQAGEVEILACRAQADLMREALVLHASEMFAAGAK